MAPFLSDPRPLTARGGEASWLDGGRGEVIRSPNSAVRALKIPSFPPASEQDNSHSAATWVYATSSPSLPPLLIPHAHTPFFQRAPSQGYARRMANAPHRVALVQRGHPGTSCPPHAAPHTNWPSQKRLCAAAWRRDARGLRSPEGPSQDPPCSPGQEEACVGGGGHKAPLPCSSPATRLLLAGSSSEQNKEAPACTRVVHGSAARSQAIEVTGKPVLPQPPQGGCLVSASSSKPGQATASGSPPVLATGSRQDQPYHPCTLRGGDPGSQDKLPPHHLLPRP